MGVCVCGVLRRLCGGGRLVLACVSHFPVAGVGFVPVCLSGSGKDYIRSGCFQRKDFLIFISLLVIQRLLMCKARPP